MLCKGSTDDDWQILHMSDREAWSYEYQPQRLLLDVEYERVYKKC